MKRSRGTFERISEAETNAVKLSFENLEFEVTVNLNRKDGKIRGVSSYKQKIVKDASGYALPG